TGVARRAPGAGTPCPGGGGRAGRGGVRAGASARRQAAFALRLSCADRSGLVPWVAVGRVLRRGLGGHAELLVGPRAQVDLPTAPATERPKGILGPVQARSAAARAP